MKEFIKQVEVDIPIFLERIREKELYQFNPALNGLTYYGRNLNLGFSCFGLKIYYMLGFWEKIDERQKNLWVDYINSFQKYQDPSFGNSFVDKHMIENYQMMSSKDKFKEAIKKTINFTNLRKYETNDEKLHKAINAETKQAVSTLFQVGRENGIAIENIFASADQLNSFLNQYDWSKPWNAGAQFASICVFSATQNWDIEKDLIYYIDSMVDKDPGSYFTELPKTSREVINGAMKVVSGLDWLNKEIHYPKNLIDFCLNNRPILEGCDVVDFLYVLSKCSQQTNYRKKEINEVFERQMEQLKKLYIKDEGGFSYFINKSQTHYYGAHITTGVKQADIHATTLSIWAIALTINQLEIEDLQLDWNIIKP
jgi:hypothetical protein